MRRVHIDLARFVSADNGLFSSVFEIIIFSQWEQKGTGKLAFQNDGLRAESLAIKQNSGIFADFCPSYPWDSGLWNLHRQKIDSGGDLDKFGKVWTLSSGIQGSENRTLRGSNPPQKKAYLASQLLQTSGSHSLLRRQHAHVSSLAHGGPVGFGLHLQPLYLRPPIMI